jgi:hypothetical protein
MSGRCAAEDSTPTSLASAWRSPKASRGFRRPRTWRVPQPFQLRQGIAGTLSGDQLAGPRRYSVRLFRPGFQRSETGRNHSYGGREKSIKTDVPEKVRATRAGGPKSNMDRSVDGDNPSAQRSGCHSLDFESIRTWRMQRRFQTILRLERRCAGDMRSFAHFSFS